MEALRSMVKRPTALFGLVVVALVVLMALGRTLCSPLTALMNRCSMDLTLEGAPLPPSAQFPLGTDTLGRDLLSRLLYGARTSLTIGLVANGVAVLIGLFVGILAGYLRGWMGNLLMRFTDLMMAFPALLLAIVLAALLRPSLWIVAMVIALVNWVQVARIVYTETRGLVERDFIVAERSLGAGHGRILVQAHPAASHSDGNRLGHARHRHDRVARSHAVLPRHRRAAAAAVLGQYHFRKPELFPVGTLAGVHSGCCDSADGALVQSRGRCAARHSRSHTAGERLR